MSLLTGASGGWAGAICLVAWSALTILVYSAYRWVFLRTRVALLHPGVLGVFTMVAIVGWSGHPFAAYWRETAWINWFLGPAVVAMAVPIYQLRRVVRANLGVLAVVVPVGVGFAVSSSALFLAAFSRTRPEIAAGALKSITSPVAYRLAVDARVPLDAVMGGVMIAGMAGATVGPAVLRAIRVRDERAIGLALGCASHGIGVARAVEMGPTYGAFASLGMGGTAMVAALVLPYVLRWLMA